MNIIDILDIKPHSFITMIGGGGKTTGLFLLANLLKNSLITSTTKLYNPPLNEQIIPMKWLGQDTEQIKSTDKTPLLYSQKEGDKYMGIGSEEAQMIFEKGAFDYVLCEGDGARMKPLKVWKQGEPVIPQCTTHTIINIGANVLGKIWCKENVHRSELLPFQGKEINFELILQLMEQGIFDMDIPKRSKTFLSFNQWDLVGDRFKDEYLQFSEQAKKSIPILDKILFVSYNKNKLYDHM